MIPALLLTLAAPAEEAAEAAGHAAESGHEDVASILMHHVLDQPFFGLPSKHLAFFVLAALAVMILTRLALRTYRQGIPSGLGALIEIFVVFIRDDIAEKNIGHDDARRFTPLLCSFFFFILVAALMGLLPFSATSTGNIAVTMALATVSFLAQQWAGISRYGVVHHFAAIVPPGLPRWLLPIMIPVEILSIFTKPFALMIRLFANMLAGHMLMINGSRSNTSSAAPAITPFSSASTSAASCTTGPRVVLIRNAVGFIFSSSAGPISPRVFTFSGT